MNISFKNKSGIYKISNLINEKIYIGSAINLYCRWHHHKHYLCKNSHTNKRLQNFVNKYGFEQLVFEVLELCNRNSLLEREQFYIDGLNPFFNICRIAGNSLGRKHSLETKQNLSAMNKNKPTYSMLGKKHSEHTKHLISESKRGKPLHHNFIAASIRANTGRKQSKHVRLALSQLQRKISDVQVEDIIRKLQLGSKQIDLAREYGVSQTVISRVKNGLGIYEAAVKRFNLATAQKSLLDGYEEVQRAEFDQQDLL